MSPAKRDGPGTGELLVRTPFQARGYLHPALDYGRFVSHATGLDHRRHFRPGDLVRRDGDGHLVLCGRTDFRVKVRGVQVNLEEVEPALQAHDPVLEAAAVAVEDELTGHRQHATVQATPRCRGGGTAQTDWSRSGACVVRVISKALPRTATGKIDRARLRPAEVA